MFSVYGVMPLVLMPGYHAVLVVVLVVVAAVFAVSAAHADAVAYHCFGVVAAVAVAVVAIVVVAAARGSDKNRSGARVNVDASPFLLICPTKRWIGMCMIC